MIGKGLKEACYEEARFAVKVCLHVAFFSPLFGSFKNGSLYSYGAVYT